MHVAPLVECNNDRELSAYFPLLHPDVTWPDVTWETVLKIC